MPVTINDITSEDVYNKSRIKINENLHNLANAVNKLEIDVANIQAADLDGLDSRLTTLEADFVTLETDFTNHTAASNPHNVQASDVGAIPVSEKGVASGVATLDAGGKIPTTQLPATSFGGALNYLGQWDAATNSPTLPGTGHGSGDYYVVSVAGSTLIDGNSEWKVGDWVIHNGTEWERIKQVGDVLSVAGKTGAVTLTIADIVNLQSTLDGKAKVGHTHTASQITDFATAVSNNLPANVVRAGDDLATLGSGTTPSGHIPTADGSGGIVWQAPAGGSGDMTKATYDTDNDGAVDTAATLASGAKIQNVEITSQVLTVSTDAAAGELTLDMDTYEEFTITVDAAVTLKPTGGASTDAVRRAGITLIGSGGTYQVDADPSVKGSTVVNINPNEVISGLLTHNQRIPSNYFLGWGAAIPLSSATASYVAGSLESGFVGSNSTTHTFTYDPSANGAQADDYLIVVMGTDGGNGSATMYIIDETVGGPYLTSTRATANSVVGKDGCMVGTYYRKLGSGDLGSQTYTVRIKQGTSDDFETFTWAAFLLRGVNGTTPLGDHYEDENINDRTSTDTGTMNVTANSIVIVAVGIDDSRGKTMSVSAANNFTELISLDPGEGPSSSTTMLWVGYRVVTATGLINVPVLTSSVLDQMQVVGDEFKI